MREAVASQTTKEKVDTSDLAAALQHPDSRRRFVTIQTDEDLTSILDAPLEKWRVFLHPSQERLVAKSFNGPARVTGGAGTGKTVVAMHRARHLARTLCTGAAGQDPVHDLHGEPRPERRPEPRPPLRRRGKKIEVVHLHAWAARFLRDRAEVRGRQPGRTGACWEEALLAGGRPDFDLGFLRQEWEQVVQANEIETAADYLKVPRIGRGRTLSRPQRQKVWKVFEKYVEALLNRGKTEWSSVIRDARSLLELKRPTLPYRAVVVDEAQDFHAEEWRLIRAIVPPGPNDLFLVGDAHQRIYGQKVDPARLRHQRPGPVEPVADQLPHHRGDPGVGDGDAARGSRSTTSTASREDEKGYKSLLSGPKPEVRHFGTKTRGVRVPRPADQGTGRPNGPRARLPRRPHQQDAAGRLPADAERSRGSVHLARQEPRRPRRASGDDAPGQGAGVPRDDPRRGQRLGPAAAASLPPRVTPPRGPTTWTGSDPSCSWRRPEPATC